MELPPTFAATRSALHAVAEHVLAAARYRAVGRIGLVVAPGGFGAPAFDGTVLRLDGAELVIERDGQERRAPLTTLRAASDMVGIEAGMPATVYQPATPLDLDQPLAIDPSAATALAEWFTLADEALRAFGAGSSEPTSVTLWPEHFDLGLTAAEVNYGASPGDDAIAEPYAYVGPWARPLPGDQAFWNAPFGATLGCTEVHSVDDLVTFYRAGQAAASGG